MVTRRYPRTEPYEHGKLDVGDGNLVYWEACGNPEGKPVVVLHGGPGSGCTPSWRRFFDPGAYRIVLFDQRGSGRSTPHAGEPTTDLATNTTHHLIADIELLRRSRGIERWQVFGGSWGSVLGLAYAEQCPERVSEIVLFGVPTRPRRAAEWITRHVGRLFPEQWARFRDGVPEGDRDGDLVEAYARLLSHPDAGVREKAAKDWCDWEDSHVSVRPDHQHNTRYDDPAFRMAFARMVTHYWRHGCWLREEELVQNAGRLAGIPGVLVQGRLDVSGPPDDAWELSRAWPDSELVLVSEAGHGGDPEMNAVLVEATDRYRDS